MKRLWMVLPLLLVASGTVARPRHMGLPSQANETKLIPADEALSFGWSVSLDGDTALIGAPWDDADGEYSGSAYIFARIDGGWVEKAKLLPHDGAAWKAFGESVSLDGATAVIGAPWYPGGPPRPSGAAYVFVRNGESWTEQAKLVPSHGNAADNFGTSTSVEGDTILIGANGDFQKGGGAAYVFTRSGGVWTETAKLFAQDGLGSLFGDAVFLLGDTALVGSPDSNVGPWACAGAGYVFTRSNGTWTQQARLVASEPEDFGGMGRSVSLDGNSALLGAPLISYKGSGTGWAHVFVYRNGGWTEQQKLAPSDGGDEDAFGFGSSLSSDTALVGSPAHDSYRGAAYLLVRHDGSWWEQLELQASDRNDAFATFGWSVSLSQGRALVGSPGGDAAYVYEADPIDLSLAGSCPGPVTVTVSGAPPNSEVAVIAAGSNGGWIKRGGACAGTAFEIGEPFQLPPLVVQVDGEGRGSAKMTLQSNRCWVEALAFQSCETSSALRIP